jgi:hypothetical protein
MDKNLDDDPLKVAKAIPKGFTVQDSSGLRARLLNLLLGGDMRRGPHIRDTAQLVGLDDDRPKKLIQFVKGGGGTPEQLQDAVAFVEQQSNPTTVKQDE